jgi:hypothetical protein
MAEQPTQYCNTDSSGSDQYHSGRSRGGSLVVIRSLPSYQLPQAPLFSSPSPHFPSSGASTAIKMCPRICLLSSFVLHALSLGACDVW